MRQLYFVYLTHVSFGIFFILGWFNILQISVGIANEASAVYVTSNEQELNRITAMAQSTFAWAHMLE